MKEVSYRRIAELVEYAKQGSNQAFGDIYSLTFKKQYFTALAILKDEFLAQDALQEAYAKAFANISRLDSPKLFIAWLNRICYNACMNVANQYNLTKDSLNNEVLDRVEDTNYSGNPYEYTELRDNQERMLKAISRLSDEHRVVIVLKYYQDLKIREIADVLNCSEGTVKSRIHYAQKILEKLYREEGVTVEMAGFMGIGGLISQALKNASKKVKVPVAIAETILIGALGAAGIGIANISFSAAGAAGVGAFTTVTAVVTATIATVAVGGVISSTMPEKSLVTTISNIAYETQDKYTNEPIEVNIDTKGVLPEYITIKGDNGEEISVYSSKDLKNKNKIRYTAFIDMNGTFVVHLKNGDVVTESESFIIDNIDMDAPILQSYKIDNETGNVECIFKDTLSGIKYEDIYAEYKIDRVKILPISVDSKNELVVFEDPSDDMIIFIKDNAGNISEFDVTVLI